MKNQYFYEIEKKYNEIKPDIEKRLNEYKEIWKNGTNEDIHAELSFCILTPQSKARNAWKAITNMRNDGVLFTGTSEELTEYLNIVRFKNNKAKYLVLLRQQMTNKDGKIITKDFFESFKTVTERRNWIVENIKGMSWKEAGHFLRNVGFGQEVAILDRHILKNLVRLEVINEIPKTLTKKLYFEIEEKMKKYCKEVGIPMDSFDLLLWYLEAGEIFK
ncbi:N-glycosylase/DNA lyase [Fusobacterium perfoetens]|uniref:N-glycosylase/DNA lyase n=1 Tax=Fusobacterium perfoetens TaxID=852 RepID=UPI00047FB4BF|nr:N-glycosylase/DNA lyase [Fusobacterium perfoetens]MCI6151829.1 N-glycosylase/DNA lyase [Fusobacterium perfoetens]MDY3236810.1 N-glycosylase/DNA lyase [Fusobacterium perfoetens]